jgi:glycosyltransferase involved in cell wall biosynthesis
MIKIAFVDTLGLVYDGDTLNKKGLGGSESALIYMARELSKIGFDVKVFNNCDLDDSKPGIYDGVEYIDNKKAETYTENFDIVIVSRTVLPFLSNSHPFISKSKHRVLWLHDTFCQGDSHVEKLVKEGIINEIFTLSDFHTIYTTNSAHGPRRNFEFLKPFIWQTRNGAFKYDIEVDLKKKTPLSFVYNASATKGLQPLLDKIWPIISEKYKNATLTVIGGYYRFREGAEKDAQEKLVEDYKNNQTNLRNVNFTGIITQKEIAEILAKSTFTIYPGEFPETFGISTLESLLYKTPIITCNFGALEETAIELASYKINYAIKPNSLFNDINEKEQIDLFVNKVFEAIENPYLLQQKQNYCSIIEDISGWDTIALQWKQHFYNIFDLYLDYKENKKVKYINQRVCSVFNRRFTNPEDIPYFKKSNKEIKINVIVPFRNAEKYIARCIASIAQQNYDNYQLTFIDDASTDSSYNVLKKCLEKYNYQKATVIQNKTRVGALANQINVLKELVASNSENINVLIDGDDCLPPNPDIFSYINDLYSENVDFTYGSCWSLADNIPLIAQEYPNDIIKSKRFREHLFNWYIPYTHLRTFTTNLFSKIDTEDLKDSNGNYYIEGGDAALFYALIEKAENIKCVKDIIYYYNDLNPLNDYKISTDKQKHNAKEIINKNKKYSNIPTKAYILKINESHSHEYANDCAKSCDKIGLKYEYHYGPENKTPTELWQNSNLGISFPYYKDMHSPSACCTHGHFEIWKKIAEGNETAIIMEHDAIMLQPVDIEIPDGAIVTLGYKLRDISRYTNQNGPDKIVPVKTHRGAHAYAITPKTAKMLLEELKEKGCHVCIDTMYFRRLDPKYTSEIPLMLTDPICALGWVRYSTVSDIFPPDVTDLVYVQSFTENLSGNVKKISKMSYTFKDHLS